MESYGQLKIKITEIFDCTESSGYLSLGLCIYIYAKFGLFKKKFFKFFEKQAIYFETHYSKNSISIFKNGHYKYQNDEHHLLYTNLSQAIPLTAFCLPAFSTINYNIIRFKLKCQHCNLDRNLKRAIQTNANLPSTFDQITTVLYVLSKMSHCKI